MIGIFRDGHPRLTLVLPGFYEPLEIEFVVDTGFDGGLSLPTRLAAQIDGALLGTRKRRLANGQLIECPLMSATVDWNGELRKVNILILDGEPLLGTELLRSHLLQIEVEEGGGVLVETL